MVGILFEVENASVESRVPAGHRVKTPGREAEKLYLGPERVIRVRPLKAGGEAASAGVRGAASE